MDVKSRYNIGDKPLPYFPTQKLRNQVRMNVADTKITSSLQQETYCPKIQGTTNDNTRTWIKNVTNAAVGYVGISTPGQPEKRRVLRVDV